MSSSRRTRFVGSLAAIALLLLLVGCGGSSNTTSDSSTANSTSGSTQTTSTGGSDASAINDLFAGKTYASPTGVPKPAPGKNVWILSCGQNLPTCVEPAEASVEAAKLIGWHTTLYDTKGDPSNFAAGIRQALAAKADGIITYALDCPLIKEALIQARNAHVPVVAAEADDCNPGLFTSIVRYSQGSFQQFFKAKGMADAQLMGFETGGNAKVVAMDQTDVADLFPLQDGFDAGITQSCSGCSIVAKVKLTLGDFGNISELVQKTAQALTQNPDANAVYDVYDTTFEVALEPALRQAGRLTNTYVGASEGAAPVMDFIRSGGHAAGVGVPTRWEGYAEVDNLNRAFLGQPGASNSGIGLMAYDKNHNLPPKGEAFQPPIDYVAAYKKAWGVS